MNGYTRDQAVDALMTIPATVPHDIRTKIGMAARDAGVTLDEYDTWQLQNPRYKKDEVRAMWDSYGDGAVGTGTLFHFAKEHSWKPDRTARPQQPQKPVKPVPEKQVRPNPSAEVWSRLEPVITHPYAVKKKLSADTLKLCRVVPANDPLTHRRGWLAVPGFDIEGNIQTIEFVDPNAKHGDPKPALKDSKKSGAMFFIGEDKGNIFICEGLATTDAIYQSTGELAVSTFGSGNTRNVVSELRKKHPEKRIVLCPDTGKESDAKKIADEFHCAVAAMPDGWEKNSDLNDLFCRDGFDAVQSLLQSVTEPANHEPKVHPLARFIDLSSTPKPPRWVIPGFVGHGVTSFAGAPGVGKTTALLPLALTAAGLHGDELLPRQWRHVVYISEDVEQAQRILAGMVNHGNLGISMETVRERVHLVDAVRLDPAFVAAVGSTYRELFTRKVEDVEVLPLVVLDTKSAVLALDNENDNAEASRMMSALKQGFDGLPVWIVGHIAKANLERSDVAALTSRGASAIEGDANQTVFLVKEGECRYLVLGKVRFEPRWHELEITSHTAQETVHDEFGNVETVVMRWGIATPALQTRKEAAEQAAELQHKEDDATLRDAVREAIEVAWLTGNPLNRAGVLASMRRKRQTVSATVENLLSERWLHEVEVPAKLRTNNRRSAFLVSLSTEEHEAVLAGGGLPDAKLVIPASWKKEPIPFVPAPEVASMEADHEAQ